PAAHRIRKLESRPKLAPRFCKRSIALRIRHSKMYRVNASSLTLCGRGPPPRYASVCERCRARYSEPETVIELADWDVNYISVTSSRSVQKKRCRTNCNGPPLHRLCVSPKIGDSRCFPGTGHTE